MRTAAIKENQMIRRTVLALSAAASLAFVVASESAIAQSADLDAVKAASRAFYQALTVIDNGEAMEKVWAHTSYVTNTSPRIKTIIVGWDDIKKNWAETNAVTASRSPTLNEQHIHVNGNLAHEVGMESGTVKFKNGTEAKVDWIVTNVYEKLDGRWQIVHHHVQPKPQ